MLFKTKLKGSDGVHVAAANVTGDGRAELLVGSGDRSRSEVAVYSADSREPLYRRASFGGVTGTGMRIAAVDLDLDGIAEILATPRGRDAGQVLFLDGEDGSVLPEYSFQPFGATSRIGVYVAGSSPAGTTTV